MRGGGASAVHLALRLIVGLWISRGKPFGGVDSRLPCDGAFHRPIALKPQRLTDAGPSFI
ncbi:hypothetical protein DESC_720197 [Desulfosarcina cetonica]|nr:hypothetical protein DESC_720197 [Desulfosarcina cetonica]